MNPAIGRFAGCLFFLLGVLAPSLAQSPESKAGEFTITVPFYTGSWHIFTNGPGWFPGENTVNGEAFGTASNLQITLSYNLPISNLQEMTHCGQYCEDDYSGQINSGAVQFLGYDVTGQNPPYSFGGQVLPGGTFSARYVCDHGDCALDDNVSFSFSGTSANLGRNPGWWSTGQFSFMGGCLDGGCDGQGLFTLQTYAPGSDAPVSSLHLPLSRWPRDISGLVFLHPTPRPLTE